MNTLKNILQRVRNTLFINKKRGIISSIIIILILIVLGRTIFGGNIQEEALTQKSNPKVEVARVYDIASQNLSLPVTGTVESQSEATIRTEATGEISATYKKIGDSVYSGERIAEIKNASQRADLLRAQGILDGAKANLSKIEGNSTENVSLILNSVRNSFITADDAVRSKTDQFFERPDTSQAKIIFLFDDPILRESINKQRVQIEFILNDWSQEINTLNSGTKTSQELSAILLNAKTNLETIQNYLNDVASAVNTFEPINTISQATIDRYRGDVSSARSSVNASYTSLLNSYNSLSSQIGLDTKGQDVLSAEAQVKQARAGVLSAQAQLEKTIVRSPISGKINSISIQRGDFVSSFQEVVQVVGSGEIEIVVYINEEDRDTVQVGTEVSIDGKFKGKVARIAPAINSATQKIEMRIVPSENTKLSDGSVVSIIIQREVEQTESDTIVVTVPIAAVRISAEESYVFKITDEGTLEKIIVKTGRVLGDRVVIEEGLDLNEIIVIDARGRKAGEEVTI